MRRSTSILAVACLALGVGCKKDDTKKSEAEQQAAAEDPAGADTAPEAPDEQATEAGDPAQIAETIGVEPGPFEVAEDEGAAAVVAEVTGTVELRRVGTETWEPAAAEAQLYEGDQLRTEAESSAIVALVDETAVEVAEQSAIAIGSRDATQDPASSVAALYGVSRFTVADRAPGEGPFMVYAPAGVVATKGTVYTVGVLASGATRVGVETGEVEVAGSAKLDAPVVLATGKAILIAPVGEVGSAEALGAVDWGTWRDEAEAGIDVKAAAEFHAQRVAALEAELEAAYAELEAQAAIAAEAEARAAAAEKAADLAAYEAAAPEIGASVDASFALSGRINFLTSALLAHAYVANALYVRHPDAKVVVEPVRPRVAAAVLWNKKYHAVARTHVQPLRLAWYVHHPVGRARAKLVAHPIPPFYAKAKVSYDVPDVRARVKVPVFRPPVVKAKAKVKKRISIRAPKVGWYAGVKARVRPAKAKVAWYVRPKAPRAKVVFGARATGSVGAMFKAAPPRPRAQAKIRFGGAVKVDHRAHMGVGAGAGARVKGSVGGAAVKVRDHRADLDAKVKGGVKAGVGIKAGVKGKVDGVGIKVRDHRGAAGAAVKGGVRTGVGVKAGAGVGVKAGAGGAAKVKAPEKPKVKAPKAKGEVKGSIKVKGGLKIGD